MAIRMKKEEGPSVENGRHGKELSSGKETQRGTGSLGKEPKKKNQITRVMLDQRSERRKTEKKPGEKGGGKGGRKTPISSRTTSELQQKIVIRHNLLPNLF